MQNSEISLLWPREAAVYSAKTKTLNGAVAESLDLDGLCAQLSTVKDRADAIRGILSSLCCDEDVIAYRQEIFSDLLASPSLVSLLEVVVERLERLSFLEREASVPEESSLWKYFSRFKELDGYVGSVQDIRKALQDVTFQSRGLKKLRETVIRIADDPDFTALTETLKNLTFEINDIQSITLGLNLDTALNPVEATLVSVNKTKFKDNSWLRNTVSGLGVAPQDLGMVSKIHALSMDRRHPIMHHLYKDVESLLRPVVRDMHSSLRKYARLSGRFLIGLIPELMFYLSFAKLISGLAEKGMRFCRPEIAPIGDRLCVIQDTFNLNLALHMAGQGTDPNAEIILNDVRFDQNGRILILTGPNRGGKTVYTEAIGLAQVLFQAGLHIPGTSACISPVDAIFAHFPVDENQTVELGRLGEEAKRLNEIFAEATAHSLVLLNESLASTSFTEGLYIAQDVVKSLKYLEARALFNTHMHDLANFADTINVEVQGDSRVVSLVTDLAEGKRSYKIKPGAPLGKSYARDIAMKYGICFEQVTECINRKRLQNT